MCCLLSADLLKNHKRLGLQHPNRLSTWSPTDESMFHHVLKFFPKTISFFCTVLFQLCKHPKSSLFVMVDQLSWYASCACFMVLELLAYNVMNCANSCMQFFSYKSNCNASAFLDEGVCASFRFWRWNLYWVSRTVLIRHKSSTIFKWLYPLIKMFAVHTAISVFFSHMRVNFNWIFTFRMQKTDHFTPFQRKCDGSLHVFNQFQTSKGLAIIKWGIWGYKENNTNQTANQNASQGCQLTSLST